MNKTGAVALFTAGLACGAALGAIAVAQAPPAGRPLPPGSLAPIHVAPGERVLMLDPSRDYPQMKGLTITQTLFHVAPGTGREPHSHKGDLELTHIISGTLTVARNGGPPMEYKAGTTLVNDFQTTHTWANLSHEPVVMLNTNIRAAQ